MLKSEIEVDYWRYRSKVNIEVEIDVEDQGRDCGRLPSFKCCVYDNVFNAVF
jgi:hypothetical protein